MVKIITSNTCLRSAVIKSVLEEYNIKSQEKTLDELKYGTDVIEPPYNPFILEKLTDLSGLHDTCLNVKAEDTIFSGKRILVEGNLSDDLSDFLDTFDFDEELEAFVLDLLTYEYAVLELLRDETGTLKAINHISSLYIRMCRDKERVVQKIGSNETYFKLYKPGDTRVLNCETGIFDKDITKDNRANEIIWFNSKTAESKVYGRPQYLSEVEAILTDDAIVKYQQGHFRSNGIPNYIITITGNIESEDEDYSIDDFEKDVEAEFRNVTNSPGTAMVLTIPSADTDNKVDVKVNKIGEEKKEGSFLELSKSISDRIMRVHKVPAERLGDSDSTGMASNRTEMLLKNYSKAIGNIQKRIANLVNRTIIYNEFPEERDVKIEFVEANFEAEDVQLDRGIKLLQNGALTLGEFITNFGEPYNISMDKDDELYNARFMNNQSLDVVLNGDTPVDSEGKLNSMINDLQEDIGY